MNPLNHGEPKLCVLDIQWSQTFGFLAQYPTEVLVRTEAPRSAGRPGSG
jgi:hypothetical protein